MNYIYLIVISIVISLIIIWLIYSFKKPKRIVNISNYDIQEIPNFLTHEECDYIIKLSLNNLTPSKVYGGSDDNFDENTRKSNQCWLDDSNEVIKNISDKIKNYTNTHKNNHEQLQVVQYPTGGFFNPHYDACDGEPEFCKRLNSNHGPRLYTLLIYLNDDYEGGETNFPKINKSVKPQKGKAVLFKNVDENGSLIFESFHGGMPVKNGEKWIANKWISFN